MGAVGKTSPSGKTTTKKDKYDYSEGTIKEAVAKFSKATNIAISPSVVSKLNEGNLRMVLSTLHQQKDKGTHIESVRLKSMKYTLACSDGTNLYLNPQYFGLEPEKLEEVYKANVDSGYHPKGTAKSIIEHEMGHNRVMTYIRSKIKNKFGRIADWNNANSWSKPSVTKDLVLEAQSNLGLTGKPKDISGQISRYAKSNPQETVAEAYADYMTNGKNANPLSIEICKLLDIK